MRTGEKHPITALIRNISGSGAELYANRALEESTPLSIKIKFTNRAGKRLSDIIEGTVVSSTKEEDFYCVEISFDEQLNPDKQPHLYDHVHHDMKIEIMM